MKYWLRMGGPNGITFLAWALLAPISVFFTASVVPEGYLPDASPLLGFVVGINAHLVTGLVLWLGKVTILRNADKKSRPISTLGVFAVAGLARGFSVAFFLEVLGITASADYAERMSVGAALILVWFSIVAVMVDGVRNYRVTYDQLSSRLEVEKGLRVDGVGHLEETQRSLFAQIRATLAAALRSGSSAADIHDAVEDLVRPLAHRIHESTDFAKAEAKPPRRRIAFGPVVKIALNQTAYSPLWTTLMAVVGTVSSRIWQSGPTAVLDSLLTAFIIWAVFRLATRLKLFGPIAVVVWFVTGLLASLGTALLIQGIDFANYGNVLYLSINVLVPAAVVALIGAFDRQANNNLEKLQETVQSVRWQTASLEQHAWVERQRIARFVHSDLQARLRAFALRMDLANRAPSDSEIEQLRLECERSLATETHQQEFEKFFESVAELWRGVMQVDLEAQPEALAALGQDPYASAAAIEICREGLSNSVKHGKALRCTIELSLEPAEGGHLLQIVMRDNGEASGAARLGLGQKTINSLTLSWSLDIGEEGATLKASLPLSVKTSVHTTL